jgi:antirestriction protein ArdC
VNVVLLWLAAQEKGYTSPAWYTFNQACEAAGLAKDAAGRWVPEPGKGVRKGERATLVTFWKELTVEDEATGEPKRIPLLRHFCVFNRAQVDGLPPEPSAAARPACGAPRGRASRRPSGSWPSRARGWSRAAACRATTAPPT